MQASAHAHHARCKEVDVTLKDVDVREGAALEGVGQRQGQLLLLW
jgi:hypothetical protein